jgi:putative transposase
VIDGHTREALATVPRASFRADRVVGVLDRLAAEWGRPKRLRVDNGPAFAGKALDVNRQRVCTPIGVLRS